MIVRLLIISIFVLSFGCGQSKRNVKSLVIPQQQQQSAEGEFFEETVSYFQDVEYFERTEDTLDRQGLKCRDQISLYPDGTALIKKNGTKFRGHYSIRGDLLTLRYDEKGQKHVQEFKIEVYQLVSFDEKIWLKKRPPVISLPAKTFVHRVSDGEDCQDGKPLRSPDVQRGDCLATLTFGDNMQVAFGIGNKLNYGLYSANGDQISIVLDNEIELLISIESEKSLVDNQGRLWELSIDE